MLNFFVHHMTLSSRGLFTYCIFTVPTLVNNQSIYKFKLMIFSFAQHNFRKKILRSLNKRLFNEIIQNNQIYFVA